MKKEFLFIAPGAHVKTVHIGVFPSQGRYFRRGMTHEGEGIFRIVLEVPKGEVYYHYFLDNDFSVPYCNSPEALVFKDDPHKRSSVYIGTRPFCAVEFNTDSRFVSMDWQGDLILRAITHFSTVKSLFLSYPGAADLAFTPVFCFKNNIYWVLRHPPGPSAPAFGFLLKLETRHCPLYLHNNGKLSETPDRDYSFTISPEPVPRQERVISPASVGYQVFPDRFFRSVDEEAGEHFDDWGTPPRLLSVFGGNFRGIIEKLSYIKQLGVDFIYINPVFHSRESHGYDTIDYYQPAPRLGKAREFKELVKKVHHLGMHIVLDIPLNQCGIDFFAFKDLLEHQQESRYRDWFYVRRYPVEVKQSHSYDSYQGYPYMPEFNLENPDIRAYLMDVVKYWVEEFDIDGIRIDNFSFLPRSFVRQLTKSLRQVRSQALVIGEYWQRNAHGLLEKTELDSITNYSLYWEVLVPLFTTDTISVEQTANALMDWYYRYGLHVIDYTWNFLSNHDLPRLYSIMKDKQLYPLAIALIYALPGMPVIYYGEEIPMQGMNDPDNRRPMEWNRAVPGANHGPAVFITALGKLRKDYPGIFRESNLAIPYVNEKSKIMILHRDTGEEALSFIFNFGGEKVRLGTRELDSLHTLNDDKPNARRAIISFDQTFSKVCLPEGPPEASPGYFLRKIGHVEINPYEMKILHWS
jgi:cyclomaltodextrinase